MYLESTEFDRVIKNRSKLAFVVQTLEGCIYGCFIYNKIDIVDGWIVDPNAFMFSYTSNLQKYPIKQGWQPYYSFRLLNKNDEILFNIGTEIAVGKMFVESNCSQNEYSVYNCPDIFSNLLGRFNQNGIHIATRICVIQFQ